LERPAAIRVHHKTLVASDMTERLQERARSLSRVHHPNVAQLYDYGRLEDGRTYIAREWVGGNALKDHHELSQSQSVKILRQVCSGLAAMHRAGLAHGKVGSESVIVEESGGGAKLIELPVYGDEDAKTVLRSDIRALGSLIEELFTTRSSVVSGPDDVSALPAEVAEIVRKCMAINAEDGYERIDDVVQSLEHALGEEDTDGLAAGTLVSDTYRVCGLIGQGGMGSVYEAVHKRLPQRVAIKVISGQFTEESLARFRQEAEIASSMGHPHIVRVFDFNTLPDGRPYMVMELLEGEDLAHALKRGPLTEERALLVARQVGSALSAAHDKGIVHRDLKPPNIFLRSVDIGGERREHATVLDFGVSKREDAETSITKSEVIIGTPKYMAPEQALGDNDEVGPHSDQFALACITYEMLSGRRPFGDGTMAEIVYRICAADPPALESLVSGLDAQLTNAISRAMSKRPQDRFPSMAEFIASLSGRPLSSTRAKVPDPNAKVHKEKDSQEDDSGSATLATVANRPPPKGSRGSDDIATKVEGRAKDEPQNDPAPAKEPVTRRRKWRAAQALKRKWSASEILIALLGLGILAFVYMGGPSTSDTVRKTSALIPPDAAVVNRVEAPAPVEGKAEVPPDARTIAAAPIDAGAPSPRRNDNQVKTLRKRDPKIPKHLQEELAAAEKLLRAGRYLEARRILKGNKKAALNSRGVALTVMIFCGEQDFGTAKDWFARVARSEKRRVKKFCKSKGIDLD
jgi:serine/threonine-protein kinase